MHPLSRLLPKEPAMKFSPSPSPKGLFIMNHLLNHLLHRLLTKYLGIKVRQSAFLARKFTNLYRIPSASTWGYFLNPSDHLLNRPSPNTLQ